METGSSTILVVDDDPEVLETLSEYLSAQGYRVITAANGVEAFLQVWRKRPRAVILDLFMPRLGGLGALDRIRRMDSSIVVIIISGVENAVEMIKEAGLTVAGALAKPFEPSSVLGLLVQAGVLPAKAAPAPPPAERPGRKRVLVVDDEREFLDVMVDYLRGKGYEAEGASSGEEALRRIPEFRPQVVLLDILMPGLSGVDTLRRLKALPQETCVVMVSGQEDLDVARRTLGLGATDYIAKPVDFSYLDSVLEAHEVMGHFDPGAA